MEILKQSGILKDFYLAGGTAVALYLKHRLSVNLYLFTTKNVDSKELIERIKKLGKLSVEKEALNSLIGNFQGTLLSFLKYDYPNLFPFQEIEGVDTADIRDIACMKVAAISSRGSKKDFIDLFVISKEVISLNEILELFKEKYKEIDYNMNHILKSVIYFEDAERDSMPEMLTPLDWDDAKNFFREEIKTIKL